MTSLVKLGASQEAERGRGREPTDPVGVARKRPLTWSEVETLDILNDAEAMKDIAASREDVKAWRVVIWKPRDAKNAQPT